jgi:hypothetical protein
MKTKPVKRVPDYLRADTIREENLVDMVFMESLKQQLFTMNADPSFAVGMAYDAVKKLARLRGGEEVWPEGKG